MRYRATGCPQAFRVAAQLGLQDRSTHSQDDVTALTEEMVTNIDCSNILSFLSINSHINTFTVPQAQLHQPPSPPSYPAAGLHVKHHGTDTYLASTSLFRLPYTVQGNDLNFTSCHVLLRLSHRTQHSHLSDMAAAASDIFSPTRLSPSFSPFSFDFPLHHTEPVESNVDAVRKYGLASALCAKDMIPRYSPLRIHKISSPGSTSQRKTSPLKLFISTRYRRNPLPTPPDCPRKYAASDTKYPTILPSFQITCLDSSNQCHNTCDEDDSSNDAQLCDKTPTLSPSTRDKTPVATPVRPKTDSREADLVKL